MDDKMIYSWGICMNRGLELCGICCLHGEMAVKNFNFTYFDIYDCGILFNSRYVYRNSVKNDRNSKANASTPEAVGDKT